MAGSKAAPAPGWITTICVPVHTIACWSSILAGSGTAGSIVQVLLAGS
jgi:hypothetical protein